MIAFHLFIHLLLLHAFQLAYLLVHYVTHFDGGERLLLGSVSDIKQLCGIVEHFLLPGLPLLEVQSLNFGISLL